MIFFLEPVVKIIFWNSDGGACHPHRYLERVLRRVALISLQIYKFGQVYKSVFHFIWSIFHRSGEIHLRKGEGSSWGLYHLIQCIMLLQRFQAPGWENIKFSLVPKKGDHGVVFGCLIILWVFFLNEWPDNIKRGLLWIKVKNPIILFKQGMV